MCVVVVIVHWHCSAQLSMFNMEKRYGNKIIIINVLVFFLALSALIIGVGRKKEPFKQFYVA